MNSPILTIYQTNAVTLLYGNFGLAKLLGCVYVHLNIKPDLALTDLSTVINLIL